MDASSPLLTSNPALPSLPDAETKTETKSFPDTLKSICLQIFINTTFFAQCLRLTLLALLHKPKPSPAEAPTLIGRQILAKTAKNYLHLLARLNLVTVEYVGFKDAASWKGNLLCPNHPSLLDALLILSKLPETDCIMNAKPLRDPFMAGPARFAQFIPNHPAISMVKTSQKRLAKGLNVLLFPEGTRTASGALGPFQEGAALISIKSNAPVRTLFIECNSQFFGKTFSYFKVIPAPIHFRITAGPLLQPSPSETTREFSARLESTFRHNLVRSGNKIELRNASPSCPQTAPLPSIPA